MLGPPPHLAYFDAAAENSQDSPPQKTSPSSSSLAAVAFAMAVTPDLIPDLFSLSPILSLFNTKAADLEVGGGQEEGENEGEGERIRGKSRIC